VDGFVGEFRVARLKKQKTVKRALRRALGLLSWALGLVLLGEGDLAIEVIDFEVNRLSSLGRQDLHQLRLLH
jgi:hypothetical protein